MIAVTNVALGLLAVGALAAVVRLALGPTLADRVVATDTLLTLLVIGTAIHAARTGVGTYLETMLVVAVVGFLGTAMLARYIERSEP